MILLPPARRGRAGRPPPGFTPGKNSSEEELHFRIELSILILQVLLDNENHYNTFIVDGKTYDLFFL